MRSGRAASDRAIDVCQRTDGRDDCLHHGAVSIILKSPTALGAVAATGTALLLSATVDVIAEPAPAPPKPAVEGAGAALERHVLTAVQWAAGMFTAAGLVWFATSVGGVGLTVVFVAFVVYLLAWWAKLHGWRHAT